jgi:hypothetical protein
MQLKTTGSAGAISSRLMQDVLVQIMPSNLFKSLRKVVDKISLVFQPD